MLKTASVWYAKSPTPYSPIIPKFMANWSLNLPLGGSLDQISATRWRFVKFSSQIAVRWRFSTKRHLSSILQYF